MAPVFEDGANGALGTRPVVETNSPPLNSCPLCVMVYAAALWQSPVVEPLDEIYDGPASRRSFCGNGEEPGVTDKKY